MKEFLLLTPIAIVVIAVILGAWVFQSKMEAQTFTELTGKPVTTFQAMWVQFRVIEPAKIN